MGRRIREEKGESVRKKTKKKGRVSGNKMLTPGSSLAADRRRMWPGFWGCNQIAINRAIIHSA